MTPTSTNWWESFVFLFADSVAGVFKKHKETLHKVQVKSPEFSSSKAEEDEFDTDASAIFIRCCARRSNTEQLRQQMKGCKQTNEEGV